MDFRVAGHSTNSNTSVHSAVQIKPSQRHCHVPYIRASCSVSPLVSGSGGSNPVRVATHINLFMHIVNRSWYIITFDVSSRSLLSFSWFPAQTTKLQCIIRRINPLKAELNPICYLLALLGPHHFLHVSRIRVKSLTLRLLMSYIQGVPGGMCQTSGGCSLC